MNYHDKDGAILRQATPPLNSTCNPEEKRHIIGNTFVGIASTILTELDSKGKRPIFLAQGIMGGSNILFLSNKLRLWIYHNYAYFVVQNLLFWI